MSSITTEELVLVDSEGRARARLGFTPTGAVEFVMHPPDDLTGQPQVSIQLADDGAGLVIALDSDHVVVIGAEADEAVQVTVHDGDRSAELAPRRKAANREHRRELVAAA